MESLELLVGGAEPLCFLGPLKNVLLHDSFQKAQFCCHLKALPVSSMCICFGAM